MEKMVRIQKIQEVIDREASNPPFGVQEIPWEDALVSMQVYKIPLAYLIYNKYNGRILSRTKALEKQNHTINPETPDGKKLIEELLYDSKEERNKKTETDLKIFGQKKVGIITRDGVIVDGNRRAMLLNRIGDDDYFKAVILPVTSDENPLEIEKLETSFQMGEDEKLDYNPIEKYLKAKELYLRLTISLSEEQAVDKISRWMGETPTQIKENLAIMKVMDDYLEQLDYNSMYPQLDGREDQFIRLTKWLDGFAGETSAKAFDGYQNDDVDDLKIIAYDYIRVKSEGKEFRSIADGLKQNHFFGDKDIWGSFCSTHFQITQGIIEAEIDYNSSNLKSHLDERDNKFKSTVGERLQINLDDHKQKLRNTQEVDKPEKLIKRSLESFDTAMVKSKAFAQENVQNMVKELAEKSINALQRNSQKSILAIVVDLLNSIDLENFQEIDADEVKRLTKEIQHLAYEINKNS